MNVLLGYGKSYKPLRSSLVKMNPSNLYGLLDESFFFYVSSFFGCS